MEDVRGRSKTMTQGRPMQVNNGRPAKGSVKPEAPKTEERVKTAEKAKAAGSEDSRETGSENGDKGRE